MPQEEKQEVTAEPVEIMPVQASAIEIMERSAIDVQIATAKKYPIHSANQLSKIKDEIMSFATLDEETAASCFFTLPRGGKTIQGPSVRLAEIAHACYGNLRTATRVLAVVTEAETPHVIIQSVEHDLEKNVAVSLEKRRRIVKKKSKDRIDEDDINLAVNACTSIAFRDAVFKVVPLALIKPAYEAAKKVAIGEVKSLAAKRNKVIERLKQMGVTEDRILAVVECRRIEDIALENLEILIGLGTAIKDGDTTIEEAFPVVSSQDTASGVGGLKDRLKADSAKTDPKEARYYCQGCDKETDTLADNGVCPFCKSNRIIDRQAQPQG
jgi:hypothetical protein